MKPKPAPGRWHARPLTTEESELTGIPKSVYVSMDHRTGLVAFQKVNICGKSTAASDYFVRREEKDRAEGVILEYWYNRMGNGVPCRYMMEMPNIKWGKKDRNTFVPAGVVVLGEGRFLVKFFPEFYYLERGGLEEVAHWKAKSGLNVQTMADHGPLRRGVTRLFCLHSRILATSEFSSAEACAEGLISEIRQALPKNLLDRALWFAQKWAQVRGEKGPNVLDIERSKKKKEAAAAWRKMVEEADQTINSSKQRTMLRRILESFGIWPAEFQIGFLERFDGVELCAAGILESVRSVLPTHSKDLLDKIFWVDLKRAEVRGASKGETKTKVKKQDWTQQAFGLVEIFQKYDLIRPSVTKQELLRNMLATFSDWPVKHQNALIDGVIKIMSESEQD